jgi:nucleotide-binding universal stress UspA family protein
VDFGGHSESLVAYARRIAEMAGSSEVYLYNVTDEVEVPEQIKQLFPALDEPLTSVAVERLQQLGAKTFGAEPKAELHFVAEQGAPLERLLRLARDEGIDLVIVGRPRGRDADPVIAEKLTRKAPCSVLIVPDGAEARFDRTVLATDFSSHSVDALDVTRAFVEAAGVPSFEVFHVYGVPTGYHKLGKSRDEFAQIMRDNARKECVETVEATDDGGPEAKVELRLDDHPARAIAAHAADDSIDLLVMGARGNSPGASVLLGSVTEKVIRHVDVPLLAVKRKGEGRTLLDAILGL